MLQRIWNSMTNKREIVGVGWLEDKVLKHTPDIESLEKKEFHNFFIYDEMMRNHRNHAMVGEHSITLAASAFTERPFVLLKKKLGKESSPIPLKEFRHLRATRIKGEVFSVKTEQIPELDTYKLNGVEYIRRRVKIAVPYREKQSISVDGKPRDTRISAEQIAVQEAWMYVGRPQYWQDLIHLGPTTYDGDTISNGYPFDMVTRYTAKGVQSPWLNDYYYFSQTETNV